jgi:hypothetical protein
MGLHTSNRGDKGSGQKAPSALSIGQQPCCLLCQRSQVGSLSAVMAVVLHMLRRHLL